MNCNFTPLFVIVLSEMIGLASEMYYTNINRHRVEIQGALEVVSGIQFMPYGLASLRYSVPIGYKASVSILHSKGVCLGALLRCLSDSNQPFDM